MRRLDFLIALSCLVVASVPPAVAQETEDGWSRPRRASGTVVVRPTEGSLPWDEGEWARAPVPISRDHYIFSPEWMAEVRSENYVSADVPEARAVGVEEAEERSPLVARAPGRLNHFDGLKLVTSTYLGSGSFPPDASVSAGPDKIIQVSNVAIRLTTRQGMELDRRPLNFFFGHEETDTLFDPKAYYDRLSGRFFIVALEQSRNPNKSGIWLAVSKGDDPTALTAPNQFCTYRINGKRGATWADYPGIGINETLFAISVNNFRFANGFFRKAHIYTMKVARIIDNANSCPSLGFKRFGVRLDSDGFPAFTLQPAQHYSTTSLPGDPLFLVSSSVFLPSRDYHVWRITTNEAGVSMISSHKATGDFSYHVPPAAPQKGNGGDLDAGDMRVTQAAFRDGKLWAVHGTACGVGPLPNESCVQAVQFTPSANGAPVTFNETYGRQDQFLFWPGVAINQAGDVAVAFQRARSTKFLGVAYNGKRAAANSFDSIRNLRVGGCTLENFDEGIGLNRTGDYVGLQTDPADDLAFWIAGEYPGNQGGGAGCNWKTRVGRVKY